MIVLRFHHLLCMHTYSGTGYSEDFCRNMERIRSHLFENPDTIVKLIKGCDDICANCPNRTGHLCKEEKSILKRDRDTAAFFMLEEGACLSYRDLVKKINPRFSALWDIRTVCIRCEFASLCNAVLPKNLLTEL